MSEEGVDANDSGKIHVTRKGENLGAYTKEKAREYFIAGQLLPTDWGWHDGMSEDWKPLNEVLGLPVSSPPALVANPPKNGSAKRNYQIIFGIILTIISIPIILMAFFYKIDIEGTINIGLQQNRLMLMLFGCSLLVCGAILAKRIK